MGLMIGEREGFTVEYDASSLGVPPRAGPRASQS